MSRKKTSSDARSESSQSVPLLNRQSSSFKPDQDDNIFESDNLASDMTSKNQLSGDLRPYPENESSPSRLHSLVNPSELDGKTLYEKKCILVNREIDQMGMGKYQWCIWGLCGFGYFLDLLWAQAFGLVLSPLAQEFAIDGNQSGNIATSFSAGLTAGAAFWGLLVDIIGRQWAFNLTCLISSVFGLGLAGSNSYNTFLVLTAFVGFGIGGNIPIDATITLEAIPQRYRKLLPFLSVFQPIGVIVCTAIAYGLIPGNSCQPDFQSPNKLESCRTTGGVQPCCSKDNNFGWRYMLLTIGALTMAVFLLRFVVFTFHESPKYLIYRGRDDKAIEVLQKISKFNKRECGLTLAMLESLTSDADSFGSDTIMLGGGKKQMQASFSQKLKLEVSRYKVLFSSFNMTRLTVLVWLVYACDFWGFNIAGFFTPIILSKKNSTLGLSVRQSYRQYVYIYLPGIAGVLLGVLCYDLPRVGRKWTMVVSSALMAASLFVFATVNDEASNIGLNVMEYFFQSMFNAVLYGWTPEAFPAFIRGTACGLASFFGRLFGIIAPIAAQSLLPNIPTVDIPASAYEKLLYLGGGVAFGATFFLLFLPSKMVGSESM